MSDEFTLYLNERVILLESRKTLGKILKISRPSGELAFVDSISNYGYFEQSFKCYGIIGITNLLAGFYLIVATERVHIGNIGERPIYHITNTAVVSCAIGNDGLSSKEISDEKEYLRLLKIMLSSSGMYYSEEYDLSRSLQSQHLLDLTMAKHWKFDQNSTFFANRVQLSHLFKCSESFNASDLVETREFVVNRVRITFALISRRDIGRTGTRYHSRGIDVAGKVSNFVETEQILIANDKMASFVQIRGSIPLFWRHNINIRYKPEMELEVCPNDSASINAFRLHIDEITSRYGKITAVNLVNQHGTEGILAAGFRTLSQLVKEEKFRYVEFDFHKECKNMQYDNINKLVKAISDELEEFGYFSKSPDGLELQKGVIRTNCIDCLDRTNVFQSVLAKRALSLQLLEAQVIDRNQAGSLDFYEPQLFNLFKNVWADNADAISIQYSGTGALKTDFTRTGKRSKQGAIKDGINSLYRYYYGNFSDGIRQDSQDLFFGKYIPKERRLRSPFESSFDLVKYGILFALTASILLTGFLFFSNKPYKKPGLLISGLVVAFCSTFIWLNGKRFVQYPRLLPLLKNPNSTKSKQE